MDQEKANLSDRSRSRSNTPLSAAMRNTLKKRAIGSEERFQEYKLLIHGFQFSLPSYSPLALVLAGDLA